MPKITPLAIVLALAVVGLSFAVVNRPDIADSYQALHFADLSSDQYSTIGSYPTAAACWAAVARHRAEQTKQPGASCTYGCINPDHLQASEPCQL